MSATELEPQELIERQELVVALDKRVRDAFKRGRMALWDLAQAFYEFNEERGWSALDCDSIGEYLADPELGMKPSTYYRYVSIWRNLIVKRELDINNLRRLDMSKFDAVIPALNDNRVTLEQAVHDVEHMGMKDLREEYGTPKEPKAEPEPDDDVIEGKVSTPTSGTEDDYVEERRPVEAIVIKPEHPTRDEWTDTVAKAKSKKTSITKYIYNMRDWERCGSDDGSHVEDWTVPHRAEIRALFSELDGCLHSGQKNPRIDAAIVRVGLDSLRALELIP